jgi:amino acid adenylation domain-containing protein
MSNQPIFGCLHGYLLESARSHGQRPAVEEETGDFVTYAELEHLSRRLRDRLGQLGVSPGDRVAICLRKSVDAVAGIFGALRLGAAYVPVDVHSPMSRCAFILADCQVTAVLVERQRFDSLRSELAKLNWHPSYIIIDRIGGGRGLDEYLQEAEATLPASEVRDVSPGHDDLAYILYTSGSTGFPKGVVLTHRNATGFVDWCGRNFSFKNQDRFSSHAPFHFDLSILDIFVPIKKAATVVLISKETGADPTRLAELIADKHISVWYSVPSILALLVQHGRLVGRDYSHLSTVLFAGEVFPVVHLRKLTELWPHCEYHNLYGPTETNVCTSMQITVPIASDQTKPFPIGRVCDHLRGLVVAPDGSPVPHGEEGELCIMGSNVTVGYWNRPDLTKNAFLELNGEQWYRTGDIVYDQGDGVLVYVGRRDRMIKKRGFRIELGEIESCLHHHPDVSEAAVVAIPHERDGVRIRAHLATRSGNSISIIAMKKFCADHIPPYMIPDTFRFHAVLPRTGTDKVDYQALQALQ